MPGEVSHYEDIKGNNSQHIKKGNFTIPITVSETHVVKFTYNSVEA